MTKTSEIIAKWAMMIVSDPNCDGTGTGIVPRFPMLQMDCALFLHHQENCPGWVIPPEGDWLKLGIEIALEQGWSVLVAKGFIQLQVPSSTLSVRTGWMKYYEEDKFNLDDNLWHALDQALTVQEESNASGTWRG